MADNFSTKISKTLLAHDINLAQVDAAMRKDVMAVMNALEKKTVDNVMKLGSPSTYKSVSAQNKALNLLTTSQAPTTAKAYKQMADVTGVSLTKLAAVESEFVVNSLTRAITVDLGLNKLSPEVIRLLPGKALIEGAPFTTWFKQQAEDFQLKFSNQMREGIVNGETIDDMVRRVRGTKANGFKDGFVSPKKGHAQTLVRSSVQATANKARESVYAANSDVIKGQQWLSTLDSRTSDICISLDGSAWFLSGKPMAGTVHSYLGPPPAHFNCRSTLVPVTKSFSELAKSKSAKEKLRGIPKSKQRGLRASMDGAVSNKIDYEDWLRSKTPGFQLKVLGPTKLRLWQSGQLSLKNLIDQSHNPLTIDALVVDAGVPKITLAQALETAGSGVPAQPLAATATKKADEALKASIKAGDDAAVDIAKAAAKAADEAMAAKLAQEIAEKEAQLAKAAAEAAKAELKLKVQLIGAQEEFVTASIAGQVPAKELMQFIIKNSSADELAELSLKITKGKQALKAAAKELDEAKDAYYTAKIAGDSVPQGASTTLIKHLSGDELSEFIAGVKASVDKANAAKAAIQKQVDDAKDAYFKAQIAGTKTPPGTLDMLAANLSDDDLQIFVDGVKASVRKANKAKAAIQKQITDAQQTFMSETIAGKAVADDVLDVLIKNMSSEALTELQVQAIGAKKAIEAAAKAKATEAAQEAAVGKVEETAKATLEKIVAQKATFEKRAYVKLAKANPYFEDATAVYKLEQVTAQVEIDKAAKKITDGISNYKKAIINGKVPPPAATKVFNALDPVKQDSIIADIAKKTGKEIADNTPPPLASVLEQFETGLLTDAEFIEAYHKAKGTFTSTVAETILAAPDSALKHAAKSMAESAELTVAKAAAPAPGTVKIEVALTGVQEKIVANKLQQDLKGLMQEYSLAQITMKQMQSKASMLLGEDISGLPGIKVLKKLTDIIDNAPTAKAQVAAKTAPTATFKTVNQIQDEAQDFLDKFRFGEFDEKEALTKMAAILGDEDSLPTLLKMSGALLDDNLDLMLQGVKGITKNTDKAKYFIKQQGLEVADEIKKPVTPPPPKPVVEPLKPTATVTPETGPPNMNDLTRIGEQAGSNPGGLFQDAGTGQKWYVKTPASADIARNEVLTAKLYEKMGIEVPDLHIVQFNGKPSVASKIVDGLSENSTALRAGEVTGVHEGFVADAFLANWDVVGLGYDNLLVKAGRAIRVDTGGGLRYRAQGGLKGNAFGKTVDEIDSLRNPNNNSQSASVFGRVTDAELKAGARKVVDLTKDDIVTLVRTYGPAEAALQDELIDTLLARQKDIKKRFKIRAVKKKGPPAPIRNRDLDDDVFITDGELEQVQLNRSNGYARMSDKGDVEDQQILFWEEGDKVAVASHTGAQFKARGELFKTLNEQVQKSTGGARPRVNAAVETAQGLVDDLNSSVITAVKGVATNDTVRAVDIERVKGAQKWHSTARAGLNEAIDAGAIEKATLTKFDDLYDGVLIKLEDAIAKGEGSSMPWTWTGDAITAPRMIERVVKVEKVKDADEIKWVSKKGVYEQKRVTNGHLIRTDGKVTFREEGTSWESFYETTLANGVRVRYWDDTKAIAQQGTMEFIAPVSGQPGMKLVREAMDKFKINYTRPTQADMEERYLRQFLFARGANPDTLTRAADQGSRIARLAAVASKDVGVKDIRTMPGYKPNGVDRAFGQGYKYFERPDLANSIDEGWMRLNQFQHSSNDASGFFKSMVNEGGMFSGKHDFFRRGKDFTEHGMSPGADMRNGGGSFAYLRPASADTAAPGLYWEGRMVRRTDMRAHRSDPYGRIRKSDRTLFKSGEISQINGHYETIFKNGVSIYDYGFVIRLQSQSVVDELIAWTKAQGGDFAKGLWPDGRKLEDVIKVATSRY